MTINYNGISQLNIEDLLGSNSNEESTTRYLIPRYQRNYAWGEEEIVQLIQDVIDSLNNNKDEPPNYYIGTLVVYRRESSLYPIYEVIDGQQRLTTLSLIAAYLKSKNCSEYSESKIIFESRESSQKIMQAIFGGEVTAPNGEENESAILHGYKIICRALPNKLHEEKIEHAAFNRYMREKVWIMRVEIPSHTDKNQYFEIMNSRGVQLEKVEILKAKLMSLLNSQEDKKRFHLVWEACSNMSRYVQTGFSTDEKTIVFGDNWDALRIEKFDQIPISEKYPNSNQVGSSIQILIANAKNSQYQKPEVINDNIPDFDNEKYRSIINFPNFLLQALRMFLPKYASEISLDDKRLLKEFDCHISDDTQVKSFVFCLLRCRYYFDSLVIKRETVQEGSKWSLKCYKKEKDDNSNGYEYEDENTHRKILMLQSAFEVSSPGNSYKHWLSATLYYIVYSEKLPSKNHKEFLTYLESVARSFIFDRYLANNSALTYENIIFTNKGLCQTTSVEDKCVKKKLNYGEITNNFVFNYLDYLLWIDPEIKFKGKDEFRFKARSSVEHFFPQKSKTSQTLAEGRLHSFGNLALISKGLNSSLNNAPAETKRQVLADKPSESLKLSLMIQIMNESKTWGDDQIKNHEEKMFDIIIRSCKEIIH
jgi:hypothetical protein